MLTFHIHAFLLFILFPALDLQSLCLMPLDIAGNVRHAHDQVDDSVMRAINTRSGDVPVLNQVEREVLEFNRAFEQV